MEFTINNYRSRKIDDKYFLTTDSGSFIVLNEDEFKRVKSQNIDDDLYKRLSEREIVLDENNFREFTNDLSKRYTYLRSGTGLHIIVPTLRCNMNCLYCQASYKNKNAKEYDMDIETAHKVVDFMFQSPNLYLTLEFQGGEPLLNWDVVKETVLYARKKNQEFKRKLMIALVSNLTLMDEEKFSFIVENDVTVCTSFDGPKEIHDKNRPFKDGSSYEFIKKWIPRFMKASEDSNYNSKPNALLTTTKRCFGHEKEIVDEYINIGFDMIHARFVNYLGLAKNTWDEIGYSPEEFILFWEKIANYIEEKNREGINIYERITKLIKIKVSEKYDPNYLDLRSPCGAIIGQMAYNYNGDIYTCDEARMINDDIFKIGNVKTDEYKKVVSSSKSCAIIDSSINDQYICSTCVYKPYCGICPVCNYSEQGTIIANIPKTSRCKIYKAQFDWVIKRKFINNQDQI